jgi:hypothetical protein
MMYWRRPSAHARSGFRVGRGDLTAEQASDGPVSREADPDTDLRQPAHGATLMDTDHAVVGRSCPVVEQAEGQGRRGDAGRGVFRVAGRTRELARFEQARRPVND